MSDDKFIQIKIGGGDDNTEFKTLQFKVKPTTQFSKILKTYCEKFGLQKSGIQLLFKGERVDEKKCPEDLDMEDGELVEVRTAQDGGAYCC